jgi:hypothetical protein
VDFDDFRSDSSDVRSIVFEDFAKSDEIYIDVSSGTPRQRLVAEKLHEWATDICCKSVRFGILQRAAKRSDASNDIDLELTKIAEF